LIGRETGQHGEKENVRGSVHTKKYCHGKGDEMKPKNCQTGTIAITSARRRGLLMCVETAIAQLRSDHKFSA
jgi:hypothetical protein